MLALSDGCAPDAALGDVPLVYPFVVNDPGEGVQAKRRAHAVIVDHLVPPMMRAETYDELADLEALLDEYASLEVLDPGKLPALASRIWAAIEAANLQADLGVAERPDDVGALVEHIDGYLCEVKDIQIKDGLHVLGRPPEGEQLRGLVAAIMRLGSGRRDGPAAGRRRGVRPRRGRAGGGAGRAGPARGRGAGRAAAALPGARRDRRGPRRPPRAGAGRRPPGAGGAWLGARGGGGGLRAGARARRPGARALARLRRARGRAAAAAHHRGAGPGPRRGRRALRAGGPLGQPHPRAGRRAPDRAQLLLGRSAGAAVGAGVGGRRTAGRRAARPLPARDGRVPADGRAGGVGHVGDAHPGRRRGRDPRPARGAAALEPRVAARHGHRGGAPGGARPAAHRRDRAHLGLLPRRLPAPGRPARPGRRRRGRPRRAARDELRGRPRPRGRGAAERGAGRRGGLAAGDGPRLRVAARRLRRGPAAAHRRPGLARRRRPRGGLRGLGRVRLRPRAWTAPSRGPPCATASAGSRSR